MPYAGPKRTLGHQPVDTSWEAAIEGRITKKIARRRILNFLRQTARGWTADEIATALDLDPLTVRPRITEMKNEFLVEDTGERRMGNRGRKQAVIIAT